jgi:hypothetical protein
MAVSTFPCPTPTSAHKSLLLIPQLIALVACCPSLFDAANELQQSTEACRHETDTAPSAKIALLIGKGRVV